MRYSANDIAPLGGASDEQREEVIEWQAAPGPQAAEAQG
jgi:hypothetical protein